MFYDYNDSYQTYQTIAGRCSRDEMYAVLNSISSERDKIGFAHLQWEQAWVAARRPYYRVWPKVIPMLLKLDLSEVPASCCKLPIPNLLIQLPKGNILAGTHDIQYLIAGSVMTSKGPGTLVGSVDGSMIPISGGLSINSIDMWLFEQSSDSIVTVLDRLKLAAPIKADSDIRDKVISLVTTLCLIGDNPELIAPALLSADEAKAITQADIKRLTDKAHRRGKIGWEIGKSIEVMPHFRRPHPAIMWTGEGRKIPRIVLRKGAVVHRNKIDNIPTGYLDDNA